MLGFALVPQGGLEKPRLMTGPAFVQLPPKVVKAGQPFTMNLRSMGNVSSNTDYTITVDQPGWFTVPSVVTIPAGSNSVVIPAELTSSASGYATFTATRGADSVSFTTYCN